jgi:hypothetical protein
LTPERARPEQGRKSPAIVVGWSGFQGQGDAHNAQNCGEVDDFLRDGSADWRYVPAQRGVSSATMHLTTRDAATFASEDTSAPRSNDFPSIP